MGGRRASIRDAGHPRRSARATSSTSSRSRTPWPPSPAPGQRADPGRRARRGRRDRARRHEPARAPPADAPRQRLSAGSRPGRARALLHRGEPHGAPGARPALVARRVETDLEDVNQRTMPLVCERVVVVLDGSRAAGRAVRRAARLAGSLQATLVALVPVPEVVDAWPYDRGRNLREAVDIAIDLGARFSQLRTGGGVDAIVEAVEPDGSDAPVPAVHAGGAARAVTHGRLRIAWPAGSPTWTCTSSPPADAPASGSLRSRLGGGFGGRLGTATAANSAAGRAPG